MLQTKQKTALITGASRGIGRSIAIELAKVGVHCILVARNLEGLRCTATLLPGENYTLSPVDLCEPQEISRLLASLDKHVDIFVHAAATKFSYAKLHETEADVFEQQFQVGVQSAVQICKHLLPEMMLSRWGRVLFLSSLGASLSGRGAAPYNMVKSAQESLIRSIAVEYGQYNICSNALRLGPVECERLLEREQSYPGSMQKIKSRIPNKQLTQPKEVGHAVKFLCDSNTLSFNGAVLDITGGLHLHTKW